MNHLGSIDVVLMDRLGEHWTIYGITRANTREVHTWTDPLNCLIMFPLTVQRNLGPSARTSNPQPRKHPLWECTCGLFGSTPNRLEIFMNIYFCKPLTLNPTIRAHV
jgi:hypothetical protein